MVIEALRKSIEPLGVSTRVESDVRAGSEGRIDALVHLNVDGVEVTLAVEVKGRAPYPSEIEGLHSHWTRLRQRGVPTLVSPYVSESSGKALSERGWSWIDEAGNADIRAPGLRLQRRGRHKRRPRGTAAMPSGAGSLTIIRYLINTGTCPGPSDLARIAKISQPGASQILRSLVDLGVVSRPSRSVWTVDRAELLDLFLRDYKGPGGSKRWLYGLDNPTEIAQRVVESLQDGSRHAMAISADVAADLLVPWRKPTLALIYSRDDLPADSLNLVDAPGRESANALHIVPRDMSVFVAQSALSPSHPIPLADSAQVIWDLMNLGGRDRIEAADKVRQWLISH